MKDGARPRPAIYPKMRLKVFSTADGGLYSRTEGMRRILSCCGILFVLHESSYDKNIWLASRHGSSVGDHHFRSRLDGRASCPIVAQPRRRWHVKRRPAEGRVASRNEGLQADAGVAGSEPPNAANSTSQQ